MVDVGAGSGILSLFAAQAGAKKVYAIEASDMAQYATRLAAGNGEVGSRITVRLLEVRLDSVCDFCSSNLSSFMVKIPLFTCDPAADGSGEVGSKIMVRVLCIQRCLLYTHVRT